MYNSFCINWLKYEDGCSRCRRKSRRLGFWRAPRKCIAKTMCGEIMSLEKIFKTVAMLYDYLQKFTHNNEINIARKFS